MTIQNIDGNNIVVINDIRFKGKRSIDWKEVRAYLKEYVGDFYKVVSTGDVIYIGSDLPSEYSGSVYTKRLNGAVAKAKANATQGIPEMIEIAIDKHYRENKEDKHWRNAKYGWYRYDTRFALPVYREDDEIERYNVFHASLIVRHSEDNKWYLYDIFDITQNIILDKKNKDNVVKITFYHAIAKNGIITVPSFDEIIIGGTAQYD